jgi:uncharacterized protein YdeI (YjbR/CyaY-like superfamily)
MVPLESVKASRSLTLVDTNEKPLKPTFFATPSDFRAWLEANHDKTQELLVGFYKTNSGRPSITWPESVDQALCFGWIDGVRKGIDDSSYTIRFTPRKSRSTWSAVNIKRAKELVDLGLMHPAGRKAFEARSNDNSALYAYEQRHHATLDAADEQRFRANAKAWAFFQAQPASYRRAAIWWVISAKRRETQIKRLAQLITDSEQERPVPPLTRPTKPK